VQEAFGNVILEALACGLSVITTRNAGASEILEGSLRKYILSRHDDTQEMARMINELSDGNLRAGLAPLARQTAEKYTLEANAKAIEKLCGILTKERAAQKQK
jgi:glycosyltransferase involved in cell wall biosynthesis